MKLIRLHGKWGEGKFAMVDDHWFDHLNQQTWLISQKGYVESYEQVNGKRVRYLMHRIVAKTPKDKITDHRDGNKLNNQESNLRPCTKSQNGANRGQQRNSSSPYKGVSKDGNCWIAQIWIKGKYHRLGYFPHPRFAAYAYDFAAKEAFGEFAYLNFSNEIIAMF